jgi:hypothetical protein
MSELKNNFILVHDDNDNSPIAINEDYIISIYSIPGKETLVNMNTNVCNENAIESIGINETPERVYNQLSKSKYIKVHDIRDNTVIVISIKDIITVYKHTDSYSGKKNVTNIELSDSNNFVVNESVETVMKLCKGNS